jgi:hypothetical protein
MNMKEALSGTQAVLSPAVKVLNSGLRVENGQELSLVPGGCGPYSVTSSLDPSA